MWQRERNASVRRKVVRAALVGVGPLLGLGLEAKAKDVPFNRTLAVDSSQIKDGERWEGRIDFDSKPLNRGDKLIFNLDFTGNSVNIADTGLTGGDEEIYFRFHATNTGGQGITHAISYTWKFTGWSGELLADPIPGTGEMKTGGHVVITDSILIENRRDIELTNANFTFGDITLEITLPTGAGAPIQWDPTALELVVEGDAATVEQKTAWAQPSGGSWMLASNWGGTVPNRVGAIAELGAALTSNSVSVSLNGPVTVGTLIHNDNASLSLSNGSGGSLTFDVPSGRAALHIDGTGSPLLSMNATTTLNDNLLIRFTGGSGNDVFYNGNIGEGVPGRSILVKGQGGNDRVALNGNNSYTGGITVDAGLLVLNTATAQGAVGSRATAVNGGQIDLGQTATIFMPTPNHRFTVGAGAMISGSSSQLGALTVGGNLELANGAILGFEQNGSARPAGANPAQLYYGVNGSLSENVTIGAQSGSWRGIIGSAVMSTFHGGIITVQGNAELGALGGRRLTLQQVVDITRDGSTITVRPGGEVDIVQPPGNSLTRWDLGALLRLQNTTVLNGPVTLRHGGGIGIAEWEGLTIMNPGYSDTFGSRLFSGDVFEAPGGPDLANGGIHFGGGHTYMVNSTFAPLSGLSNPNLGVKGPNTVVRFGGTVENPQPFTFTNFTVQGGGRLAFTDQALFFVTNAQGQPRPALFWGENGGGTVEFEPGFVADPLPGTQEGEATPGLKTGVFFAGVTVVTHHGQNVPHMAFDYVTQAPPTVADTWRLATNPHMINSPVDVFRPMRIQTDVATQATGQWLINSPLTKSGMGTFNLSGTGRLNGTPDSRLVVEQGSWDMLSTQNNTMGGFRISQGGMLNLTGNLRLHPGRATVSRIDGGFSLGGTVENPAGQIDLADTNVVFAPGHMYFAGRQVVIREALEEGLRGGATPWTGRGIVSGTARSDQSLAIGYGLASDVLNLTGGQTAVWNGETVTAGSGLVRLTKVGDATLDGTVKFEDLARLAQNYNRTDAVWFNGDFNYDGVVDFNDLARLAQNYNSSLPAAVPGATEEFSRDWAAAMASVPEPGGAVVVVLGMMAGLRRRRSR